jgi:hypothetical protein
MNINVSANVREVTRSLNAIQKKQIPFAMAGALNDVAFKAGPKGRVLGKQADKTFAGGAPPFTQRGFKVNKATKQNLTAEVFVDKLQEKYMRFQIKGGTRFPERKSMLISTDKTRLNRFGNITPATYAKLINDKTKYFKGVPKGSAGQQYEGIWERVGRSKRKPGGQRIRMVARYIDKAQYRPLFPFAQTTAGVVFGQQGGITDRFRARLKQALRTAK